MVVATIDSGTTHSRVYIVNESGAVLGKARVKAGVRDTAITGSRETLKAGIREAFQTALSQANLELADVELALASGMITSEIGLIEIPHLWAPAGVSDLAAEMVRVHDTEVFPVDLPVHFVRGIKNRFDPETVTADEVGTLDFMRGEEAQVAGLLRRPDLHPPFVVTILSSHTKFIPVDSTNRVTGSVTTLSGQIYEAIQAQTLIGKSIRPEPPETDEGDFWDEKVVANGFRWVQETGISRTLLMTRFLDVLLHRPWYERRLFVESAIAAEDLHALRQVSTLTDAATLKNLVIIGDAPRIRIYRSLLSQISADHSVHAISDPDEIDSLSIQGVLSIARAAKILPEEVV